MVKLLVSILVVASVSFGGIVSKTYTFVPTVADLGDLQHDQASSWGISPSLVSGEVIKGASLEISNLYNYNDEWNSLFINLIDNSPTGVTTYGDQNLGGSSNTNHNYFDTWSGSHIILDRLNWNSNTLYEDRTAPINGQGAVAIATGKTNKVTINFTGAELDTLTSYINNGRNFGFGVDADCHFYNSGFKFTMNTERSNNVPEPAMLSLFGFGLLGLLVIRRKR